MRFIMYLIRFAFIIRIAISVLSYLETSSRVESIYLIFSQKVWKCSSL